MKYLLVVVLLLLSIRISAQWQHVAWEGGSSYALVQDGNTVYCATGLGGVYRSTDGGLNWLAFNEGIEADHYFLQSKDLILTENYCVLSTFSPNFHASLLRRAKNGGTWEAIATPHSDSCDITGLVHIGGDSVFMLIEFFDSDTTLKKNGVYFSSDAGLTWAKRTAGLPSALSNMNLAIAGRSTCLSTRKIDVATAQSINGGVYTSTNFGETWTRTTDGLGLNKYFWLLTSNGKTFVGERYVFDGSLFSFEGISRSTDGGLTWSTSSNGLSTANEYVLAFATVGDAIMMSMTDENYVSTDQGMSWKAVLPGFNFLITYDLCQTSAGTLLGTNAGVVLTHDELANAKDADLSQTGMFAFHYILNHVNGDRIYVSNSYNDYDGDFLRRSTDGGQDWGGQSLPEEFTMSSGAWVTTPDGVFAGGINTGTNKAVILRAQTADDQWQMFSEIPRNGVVRSLDIKGASIVAGVQGEDGKAYCYLTTDMGLNWKQEPVGSSSANAFIMTKFVGLNIFVIDDFGFRFLSRDGGNTWQADLTGMPSGFKPVSAAVQDKYIVAVGSQVNVAKSIYIPQIYVSSDFGVTWQFSTTGISDSLKLGAVTADPYLDGIFYACSTPDGSFFASSPTNSSIFSTTNHGATWKKFEGDLPEASRLFVGSIYLFAQGVHGLYRVTKIKSGVDAAGEPAGPGSPQITVFPNPAAGRVTVSFTLPEASQVQVKIFDELGREMRSLLSGYYPKGEHEFICELADLPTGHYFTRITTGSGSAAASITKQR